VRARMGRTVETMLAGMDVRVLSMCRWIEVGRYVLCILPYGTFLFVVRSNTVYMY